MPELWEFSCDLFLEHFSGVGASDEESLTFDISKFLSNFSSADWVYLQNKNKAFLSSSIEKYICNNKLFQSKPLLKKSIFHKSPLLIIGLIAAALGISDSCKIYKIRILIITV